MKRILACLLVLLGMGARLYGQDGNAGYPESSLGPAYAADSGSVNVLTVTILGCPAAYTTGAVVKVLPGHNNTNTTPTLNVCGLGAKTITKNGQSALANGDLTTTAIAVLVYDGTYMELINPQTGSSGVVSAAAQYDIAYYTQSGTTAQVGGAAINGFQFDSTSGAPAAATATNLGTLANLAQYGIVVSGGTSAALGIVATSSTTGALVASGGSSANPAYDTTAVVSGGGLTLGTSGTAGTVAIYPASGNFTTTLSTGATASNTVKFFATVPTNLDLFYCAVASTTCTLTDTGYAYNAIPNADVSGLGALATAGYPATGIVYSNGSAFSATTQAQLGTLVNVAQYALLVSGGTSSAISSVGTSSTTGAILASGGSSANPAYNTNAVLASGGNFTTYDGLTTAGIGLTAVLGVSDKTAQSTSLTTQNLIASTSAAGHYLVRIYVDQNAVCSTGTGGVYATVNWTDATAAHTATTIPLNLITSAVSTANGYVDSAIPFWAASGSAITYTTTYTACGTGTATYDLHAEVERTN